MDALRQTALHMVATNGDVCWSGRSTVAQQQQRLRLQTDAVEAVELLLGFLQHSGGLEKLQRKVCTIQVPLQRVLTYDLAHCNLWLHA